jgi:high-affinity iron transporter
MGTGLLIMLREGFEAALVVAIVFAYLRKIERLDLGRPVWEGVAAAAALSIGVGVVIHTTVGELSGPARYRAFATISLLALAVLTWMIFWMKRQSRAIKGELEHQVDRAITSENVKRAMAAVAFLAVLREGIESALFLIAAATEESGRDVLIGGLVGLTLAGTLAFAVYMGGRKLPMRAFFKVTGVVLILFASGLAARSVMYLQVGSFDLRSFNLNDVYDLRSHRWLTVDTESGRFLAAMFGWDPRPSIEQLVAYFGYLVPISYLFLRDPRPARSSATPTAETKTVGPPAPSTPAGETTPVGAS